MNFRKKRFSISLIIIVSLIASASLSLSSQAYAARIYSPDLTAKDTLSIL